jgi:SPX domain protein involved in polyphosphate accumulation|tara:strand:- start:2998 stop:3621 length:624 start_codon:yes stop_codon:yes gene_type:complete
MQQQNWHRTDINVANALKVNLKDYILSDPYRNGEHNLYMPDKGGIWTIAPENIFTHDFIQYLFHDLNLQIDLVQIFYRSPHYQHPGAHVDISQNEELYGCGLNWTIDEDDADMVWYSMPDADPQRTQRSTTDINYEWPLEQLTEVDRCCIGQTATLVRTDIPHTVEMQSKERWLVSTRFKWHVTWDDYMSSFNRRILMDGLKELGTT